MATRLSAGGFGFRNPTIVSHGGAICDRDRGEHVKPRKKEEPVPVPSEWEELATDEMRKRVERQDKGEEEPPTKKEFERAMKRPTKSGSTE